MQGAYAEQGAVGRDLHAMSLPVCDLPPTDASMGAGLLRSEVRIELLFDGLPVNTQGSAMVPVRIILLRSPAIVCDRIKPGGKYPFHPYPRQRRSPDDCVRIRTGRLCSVYLYDLLHLHFTPGIDGIMYMQHTGGLRQKIIRPHNDKIGGGAGG